MLETTGFQNHNDKLIKHQESYKILETKSLWPVYRNINYIRSHIKFWKSLVSKIVMTSSSKNIPYGKTTCQKKYQSNFFIIVRAQKTPLRVGSCFL